MPVTLNNIPGVTCVVEGTEVKEARHLGLHGFRMSFGIPLA